MKAAPHRPDAPVAPPATTGITCLHCGALLDRVFFTRAAVNQIHRSRKCPQCQSVWRTAERIVADRTGS